MTTERKQRVIFAGARLVYLFTMTALLYRLFSHWAYDDPFITYRYAQNLASGHGLVYNAGERVLSTTTPLFALLLAVFSPLGLDLPHLANLIGCFCMALGGIFFWDLAKTWKTPTVGAAGLLLYPTFPLLLTTLGSETPLYLALCLGAFAAYARGHYAWTAVFSALSILARPDGALIPLLLGADYLIRVRRPIPRKVVVLFCAVILPWVGFAWAYYGTPIPVTLAAKQQQGAMAISQHFAPGLLHIARDYAGGWYYWLEAALALLGLFFLFIAARRWALFLAWTGLYFASYSILGVSRYYWYYAPLVPGFIALVGLGAAALGKMLPEGGRLAEDIRLQTANHFLFSGLPLNIGVHLRVLLPLGLLFVLALAQAADLFRLRQGYDRRAAIYQAVGEWLRENTAPGDTIGALEVGIVGYYAQRPMVDFAGLIQPEVAVQLTQVNSYDDAAVWAAETFKPKYLLLQKGNYPRLQGGYAAQNCQVVKRFRGTNYGYPGTLSIYACE